MQIVHSNALHMHKHRAAAAPTTMAAAAAAADDFNDVFAQMELDVGEANNLRFDLLTSLISHLIASHLISSRAQF